MPRPPPTGQPKLPKGSKRQRTGGGGGAKEVWIELLNWPIDNSTWHDVVVCLREAGITASTTPPSMRMTTVGVRLEDVDKAWAAIRKNKGLAERLGDSVPPERVDDPDGLK